MLRSGFKGRFCLARSRISLGISLGISRLLFSLPSHFLSLFSSFLWFSFSLLGLCTLMQGPQANHVTKKDDPPKIRSHDYQAWDKYRAEEEAAKVDAESKASTKVSKSKVSAQLSDKGTPSSLPPPFFCLLISSPFLSFHLLFSFLSPSHLLPLLLTSSFFPFFLLFSFFFSFPLFLPPPLSSSSLLPSHLFLISHFYLPNSRTEHVCS